MNPVNRSSKLPNSSVEPPQQPPSVVSNLNSETTLESVTTSDMDDMESAIPLEPDRNQPIPPPSEPMQYRAIGLIKGQYMPSVDQFTRGTLLAADNTLIDAVLLGRVMSLVKNHLQLDQPHLWVVYPRSRQQDGNLHVQIMGVWEPERLHQPLETSSDNEDSSAASEATVKKPVDDGYFSIRGEVVYQSQEDETIVVKIKQSPRKEADDPKFFKLQLKGIISDKAVGHFYDLQLQRQANALVIQESTDIGRLPPKKYPPGSKKPFRGKDRPFVKRPSGGGSGEFQRPVRPGAKQVEITPPKRREPLPKPVKRKEPPN